MLRREGIMEERKNAMILVVEDDRDMNEFICSALSMGGYAPIPSFTGEDGMKKAAIYKPDVILMDIRLPGINGIEACRMICADEETRHIPVIMVSEKKEVSDKMASYVAGAKRYVAKPFAISELLGAVYKALHNNAVFVEKVRSELEAV